MVRLPLCASVSTLIRDAPLICEISAYIKTRLPVLRSPLSRCESCISVGETSVGGNGADGRAQNIDDDGNVDMLVTFENGLNGV